MNFEGEKKLLEDHSREAKFFDIEENENGSKTYTVRCRRPKIRDVWKDARGGKGEILRDVASWDGDQDLQAPVFGEGYHYGVMMGDVGPKEAIEMEKPELEVACVRHLKHEGNVVSPQDLEAYKKRAEELVDSFNIGEDDEVYVIASPSGQWQGQEDSNEAVKLSRTADTAGVIKDVLEEKGIKFFDKIDPRGDETGPVDSALFKALQEFDIRDDALFGEENKKGIANLRATKAGKDLPHPGALTMSAPAYASQAPNLKDLVDRTGITELSSATIARTFRGLDVAEEYFLNGRGKNNKRKIVIMCGHGQFVTDITEAFQNTTAGQFPTIFANNGDYFTMQVGKDKEGKIVEEYNFTKQD
ncbi:MAG: hypothetical protein WCV92_00275 [Candidatus Buchananbacteria bacterium]